MSDGDRPKKKRGRTRPVDPEPMRDEGSRSAIYTMLIVGPVLLCVGIAWTAIAPSTFSNAAILIGFGTCIYGTHRFGRLGPEEPLTMESAEEKKPESEPRS